MDIVKAFGERWQCRDCGLVEDDKETIESHDCDEHLKETKEDWERRNYLPPKNVSITPDPGPL